MVHPGSLWVTKVGYGDNTQYPISTVIPAQAGIQLIEEFPRSGAISRFCPLRGMFVLLDSRLRGNDEFPV